MSQHEDKQKPNHLSCNFDNDLITVFSEVLCWDKLHAEEFEVPHMLLSICHQHDALRITRERVSTLVRSFNGLVDYLPENHRIYLDHTKRIEKKLQPGLNKIYWSSRASMIEKFVQV